MPANTDILPKYKSYVGRTFVLRKHELMPVADDEKAKNRRLCKRKKVFGDACLILDETNTRVKVTTLNSSHLWISKFYLHKELSGKQFKEHDYVLDLSDKLLNLKDVFNDLYENNIEAEETFMNAVQILRQYADNLK